MHGYRRLVPLVAALLSAATVGSGQATKPAPIRLEPCQVPNVPGEARCGRLEVFENRATRQGRRIALKVVVLPATGPKRAPDPIFLLAGGPGQAASSLAGFAAGVFSQLRDTRDIVLVDQRGTGGSNPLACTDAADPLEHLGDFYPLHVLDSCRQELAARADLRLYTTPLAMDDVDDVRAALGYERINIYGTSYGTRAALVYLKQHRQRVRTLILKGVAPMSLVLPGSHAPDSQRALDLLFRDCAADAKCAAAFPQLRERFAELLARLGKEPVQAEVTHPLTKEKTDITITRDVAVVALPSALQSPGSAASVPLILDRVASGDFVPLVSLVVNVKRGLAAGVSIGLHLSVVCTEDTPLLSPDARRPAEGTFLGDQRIRQQTAACRDWPRGTLPKDYRALTPMHEVPTLMISGELDPVTPPRWGDELARYLPNNRHVIVPAGSHSFGGMSPCVDGIIAEFVRTASVDAPDSSCVQQIRRPPFALPQAATR